jgi:hypothetical protein
MTPNETTPIETLEALCECAMQMSGNTQDRPVPEWHYDEGSLIFAKQVVTCISLLRLIPGSKFFAPAGRVAVWDLSSVASLTRNIIENYLMFFYIAIEPASPEERSSRRLYWDYHEAHERYEMVRTALPNSKHLPRLKASVDSLAAQVKQSGFYVRATPGHQRNLLEAKDCKLVAYIDLSYRAGISRNYYRAEYKYCSSFAHTAPFSLSQLNAFRAGAPEAHQVLRRLIRLATGYMGVAIRDYAVLFPDQQTLIVGSIKSAVDEWVEILKWDNLPGFNL